MIGRRRRMIAVVAAVEDARQRHPELQAPLRWRSLVQIFDRERIILRRLPIASNADVLGFDGIFVVTINSEAIHRNHTRYAAHEYGHIHLHFDDVGEVAKNLSPCQRGDPREIEAELFATMLLIGPDATPEHPRVAKLIGALETSELRRRQPPQIPLQLPDSPRMAAIKSDQRTALQAHFDYTRNHPAKLPGSSIGRGVSHDAIRFRPGSNAYGRGFFLPDHGWCDVYDITFAANRFGVPSRKLVKLGSRSAQVRYFILGTNDRRCYVFQSDTETRRPSCASLDRQFLLAVHLVPSARDNDRTTPANDRQKTRG